MLVSSLGAVAGGIPVQEAPPPVGEASRTRPVFVENTGQWPEEVHHRARLGGAVAWFTAGAFWIDLRDAHRACALRFTFGNKGGVAPEGETALDASYRFLHGESSANVARGYERLRYAGISRGVDLVVRDGDGLFEYDLLLEPGAELDAIEVVVEGADAVIVEEDGVLVIETPLGLLRQSPPVAWNVGPEGTRLPVACRFRTIDDSTYGFAAPGASGEQPLVIDPGLRWSSFLGEVGDDMITDVAFAATGEVVVVGTTTSSAFPTTPGAHDPALGGGADAFVTRFAYAGTTLIFSTYLGGSGNDLATALCLAPSGEIWVTGETSSSDFPTTAGVWDSTYGGGVDIFLARLDAAGTTLLASTYLGAGGDDRARGLALAPGGAPVICGSSNSPSFPTTPGAFDRFYSGGTYSGGDAVVTRFAPDLTTLDFSTWLGGSGNEQATDLAVGADGSVTVGGSTSSSDFPTTAGVFDGTHNGPSTSSDGFVCRLEGDGSALRWSTYLGGTDSDQLEGLAVEVGGEVIAVGSTSSDDFPTTAGALEDTYQGYGDAFVSRLDQNGTSLHFSTYLGGYDTDRALDVELDQSGLAAVTGATFSPDFPVTPWGFDDSLNNPPDSYLADAFVSRFSPGGELLYGAYLGGSSHEEGTSLDVDWMHGVVIGGHTNSNGLPGVWGHFDDTYDGSGAPDGFVTTFDFASYPFQFGPYKVTSSNWTPYIGYSGFPSSTGGGFTLWVEGATAHGWGYFLESSVRADRPFMGGTLLLGHPIRRSSVQTLDWFGSVYLDVTIHPSMVGTTRYYQVWFSDPGDAFGVGLSNGLEVSYVP